MKKPSMVFDAWALIAFFKAESPATERVETLLHQAADEQVALAMSLINLGEVYYILGRTKGGNFADAALTHVRQLPITLLPIDETTILGAATYKMIYAISYADAFALAAAVQQNATLVTGEPEFDKLTAEFAIERLQRR